MLNNSVMLDKSSIFSLTMLKKSSILVSAIIHHYMQRRDTEMFCPNCGSELMDGAKFCANCGSRIGGSGTNVLPMQNEEKRQTQKKKKSLFKRWWFWVIILVAIGSLGAKNRDILNSLQSLTKNPSNTVSEITISIPTPETADNKTATPVPTPAPTPTPTIAPTAKPTPEPTQKSINKYTLNDGKYIIGQDIAPGTYIITCIYSEGETYGNAYSALGGIYDSIDGSDNLGGMMDALGGVMTEVITTSVEILGDYGTVLRGFEMKKGDSLTITLTENTALQISFGTCTLESN